MSSPNPPGSVSSQGIFHDNYTTLSLDADSSGTGGTKFEDSLRL